MVSKKNAPVHYGEQLDYLIKHSPLGVANKLVPYLDVTVSNIYQMISKPTFKMTYVQQICSIFMITEEDFLSAPLEGLKYDVLSLEEFKKANTTSPDQEAFDALIAENKQLREEVSNLKDEIINLNRQIITLYQNASK